MKTNLKKMNNKKMKMNKKKLNNKLKKKKKIILINYHLESIVMELFHQMNLLQIIWVKIQRNSLNQFNQLCCRRESKQLIINQLMKNKFHLEPAMLLRDSKNHQLRVMALFHQMNLSLIIWVKILNNKFNLNFNRKELRLNLKKLI